MNIELDRRHAFYFDTEGQPHIFCPYRLDRLWRGEPDVTEPQLAGQRVRFAVLHIERFTSPPRVVVEYYPLLTFDACGRLDLSTQLRQIQTGVDALEADDYQPTASLAAESSEPSEWSPDPLTRRRLIVATRHPGRLIPSPPHPGRLSAA